MFFQICAYLMAISWLGSLILLSLRFFVLADFAMYKVTISEIPANTSAEEIMEKL